MIPLLPENFLDDSPFDIEGHFSDLYAPATKADSLQTCDLFGSFDFSTRSSIIYVSDLTPTHPSSHHFTNTIFTTDRALTIEYLDFGERANLETRLQQHVSGCARVETRLQQHVSGRARVETPGSNCIRPTRPVFCLWMDNDMIPLSSPDITRSGHDGMDDTVSILLRTTNHSFPSRVQAVYIFTIDVGACDPVVAMTPVFETHMLRFARYMKAYTCHLEVVDDVTRSLSLPWCVYEALRTDASSSVHTLSPEHITSVLRDVIDSSDLEASEKVCAKTYVTTTSNQTSRLLLEDAMLALDSGVTTLRTWIRSLCTGQHQQPNHNSSV
jgi:hypothetical protein